MKEAPPPRLGVLGGTFELDQWDTTPEPAAIEIMVATIESVPMPPEPFSEQEPMVEDEIIAIIEPAESQPQPSPLDDLLRDMAPPE